tara:strand:- start:2019 stop:2396 length:378 start_codon:yes stop_codon:yes gene_type:complete
MAKAKALKKGLKKLKGLTEEQKVKQKPSIEAYYAKDKKMPAGKIKAKIRELEKDLLIGSGKSNQQMERAAGLIEKIKKANPRVAKSIDAKDKKKFFKYQSRINKSKPKKMKSGGIALRGFGAVIK